MVIVRSTDQEVLDAAKELAAGNDLDWATDWDQILPIWVEGVQRHGLEGFIAEIRTKGANT